ncbi:hypothetical protein E4T38_04669 [Aureobasidium subglaciale]|nr:hypothetical protein E4T38_04669 [Aureobasidium subglaciale]KAI5223746.1 hypothetical protein E4T40_04445 [Aureobasidium subglaciale]KAI5227128.1 hypothetical protein E4T41_04428 [Aureobasidium subglaciale]KAI5262605.1 hypothetical protein E4T46_04314 [Aureobasidium subglaciale]
MPPRKKKTVGASCSASQSRRKKSPSAPASASPPPDTNTAHTRRSARNSTVVNYSEPPVGFGLDDSEPELIQKKALEEDEDFSDDLPGTEVDDEDSDMSSQPSTSSDGTASHVAASDNEPPLKKPKIAGRRTPKSSNLVPRRATQDVGEEFNPLIGAEMAGEEETNAEDPEKSKSNMKNLCNEMDRTLSETLPPLCVIGEIFEDIVSKAKASIDKRMHTLDDVLKHLGSRRLRVATMCSGTESPILAMHMINAALKSQGPSELLFDHLFSAEIVAWKQAYIERCFHPPIIFRDITEITNAEHDLATTAYGGLAKIPGNIDILIAGTACVDFSKLNNKQKQLNESGESGDTFNAVLKYAERYHPRILILENVHGAPWNDMLAAYENIGYVSAGVLVDTKNFYLPQTRQRGYMVCYRFEDLQKAYRDPGAVKDEFYNRMQDFRRQASSPVSSFLLPSDDPIVVRAKSLLARQSSLDGPIREHDWALCEIRHIRYRREHDLGVDRPLTQWQESGTLNLPEYANKSWFRKQVERVWDFVDMSMLRKAHHSGVPELESTESVEPAEPDNDKQKERDYDVQYKTRIWDVSQNIDRFVDTVPFGIAPCLTPSGNFYVTDRGGPLANVETLILQGLPLHMISFTTETEKNIQDLAGNAMSTPVVGSAIASALISAFKILEKGHSGPQEAQEAAFKSKIERLELVDRSQATLLTPISLQNLLDNANKSASKCVCEGQLELTQKSIQECGECGHISCIQCGVKPTHEYQAPSTHARIHPQTFVQSWRSKLPMVLRLHLELHVATLRAHMETTLHESEKVVDKYIEAVNNTIKDPLTFSRFRRGASWVASYDSRFARLDLVLDPDKPEWKLYTKAGDALWGESELHSLRDFFKEPIAKCAVTHDAFYGSDWSWRVYENPSTKLTIEGKGLEVPSWAARLGIPAKTNERVYPELVVASEEKSYEGIVGIYKLLRKCGTACESLYKREQSVNASNMFLFLDPTRIGRPEFDCFVFAFDPSKLEYDQIREVVARVDAVWRPEDVVKQNGMQVEVALNGTWIKKSLVSLRPLDLKSQFSITRQSVVNNDCQVAKTAASLTLELPFSNVNEKFKGHHQVQPDDKIFFDTFGWALEPLRGDVYLPGDRGISGDLECKECAPQLPQIRWHLTTFKAKYELHAHEDQQSASKYETNVKARPSAFVMECNIDGRSFTTTISLNVLTLCQRAVGKLFRLTTSPHHSVCWNLNTQWSDQPVAKPPSFILHSNVDGEPYTAKALKDIELFPKQQRSLSWMLKQEEEAGQVFTIEEFEEAMLPYLGWRLEAKASSKVHVRGGILADHAGFGKTITSLALINMEWERERTASNIIQKMSNLPNDNPEQVMPEKLAATLVVCPPTLVKQWAEEADKHLSDPLASSIIKIRTFADLKKLSMRDFRDARIIIVNDNVIQSEKCQAYYQRLAAFAAMPEYVTNGSRATQDWLQKASSRVPAHLKIFEEQGADFLSHHLDELYDKTEDDPVYTKFAEQSKRLKGIKYTKAKQKGHQQRQTKAESKDEQELKKQASQRYKFKKADLTKCVLFEMFHFNRLIVDEFSYLGGKELIVYCNIKADKRWALSATPQLKDTFDVSSMARLLGINLPIGANAPGLLSSANLATLRKDMTNVEEFETFRELPSTLIQQQVYALSQKFLDTFVRRNVMSAGELAYQDHMVPIKLFADHRLAYTDLSRQLNEQDMRIKRGDSKGRLSCVPKATNAEEALARTAATYHANTLETKTGLKALVKQCATKLEDAGNTLRDGLTICRKYEESTGQDLFKPWVKNVLENNTFKDRSIALNIVSLCGWHPKELADISKPEPNFQQPPPLPESEDDGSGHTGKKRKRKQVKKKAPKKEKKTAAEKKREAEEKKELINQHSKAVGYAKAYASAQKTLRFVESAAKYVADAESTRCGGAQCESGHVKSENLALSAACGHVICKACYESSRDELGTCPCAGCSAVILSYHLLHLNKLGESRASKYGKRAEQLIDILNKVEENDDQAILFVQSDDLIEEASNILKAADISHHITKSSSSKNSARNVDNAEAIGRFQNDKGEKKKTVLLLNSLDVSAAGTNLTNANHVIFFSPLPALTQYEYESQMAQGIGRVRRPGQNKSIHVYRIIALDTIDVDVLEQRERGTRVLYDQQDTDASEMQVVGRDFEGAVGGELQKPDKMQLIRDKDGRIKLVPRTMLLHRAIEDGEDHIYEGGNRILGYEKFNSLIKFSRHYTDEDD